MSGLPPPQVHPMHGRGMLPPPQQMIGVPHLPPNMPPQPNLANPYAAAPTPNPNAMHMAMSPLGQPLPQPVLPVPGAPSHVSQSSVPSGSNPPINPIPATFQIKVGWFKESSLTIPDIGMVFENICLPSNLINVELGLGGVFLSSIFG